MTISGLLSFPRWAATDHMFMLNRPGNDSVRLQQHAALFQNTRGEQRTQSRFGDDDRRSRKTVSMRLEALDAEELGADGLLQIRNDAAGGRTVLIVCRTTSGLRKNHFGIAELRWLARGQVFLQPVKSDQSATERPRL
jgi:hypothetical protein